MRTTSVAAHPIRDEIESQLVVGEVGVFVVAADPTNVGDRPGAQTHPADHIMNVGLELFFGP
jgi:hypothetical protein